MSYKKSSDYLMYALTIITILVIFGLLNLIRIPELISFIIAVIAGIILYKLSTKKVNKKGQAKLKPVSPKKEAFYKSKGLNNDDIKFFRETMQTSKEHILNIEKNMEKTAKLQAIEQRNNTVKISKSLFKAIIQEPERLHQVDQFLYVHLPALDDLTEKYTQIKAHKAKSKATFDILNKSSETIDDMSEQIAKDYLKFKSTDLEDLDMNVKLAKQAIDKDNKSEDTSIEQDEI